MIWEELSAKLADYGDEVLERSPLKVMVGHRFVDVVCIEKEAVGEDQDVPKEYFQNLLNLTAYIDASPEDSKKKFVQMRGFEGRIYGGAWLHVLEEDYFLYANMWRPRSFFCQPDEDVHKLPRLLEEEIIIRFQE